MQQTHKDKLEIEEKLRGLELDYSHYKEPLTAVEGGHGFIGTLAFTKDGESVQCHICGELHPSLPTHIWHKHGMRAKEYKSKFQLSPTTGLVSPQVRKKLQKNYIRHYETAKRVKANFKDPEYRAKRKPGQPKLSLEIDNKRGTCPDQTKQKIINLANELGHAPSPKEFRAEYNGSGGYETVIRHFGTWHDAMEACGLKPKSTLEQVKYSKQALMQQLRQWYEKYGRVPKSADMKNHDELADEKVFRKRFGSLNKARAEAGIPILVQVQVGHRFVETRDYSLLN